MSRVANLNDTNTIQTTLYYTILYYSILYYTILYYTILQWANMGQGAPETGHLPGAPERDYHMNIADEMLEYAPTAGLTELREKVANYYNQLYRQEKESKYTYENVCVVPGGRAGLTRVMAALGRYVQYVVCRYVLCNRCLCILWYVLTNCISSV